MSDYIPDSTENLHAWAVNLHSEIEANGDTLGWSAAQVTAFQTLVAGLRDRAALVLQRQDDLDIATGDLRAALQQTLPSLRQTVNNIKSTPGYTSGLGDALGIVGAGSAFDPATCKPALRVAPVPGALRLSAKKRGADALNLYTRLQGQSVWRLLAARRVRFPFDDQTPLAVPGTPEVREYRAIGVKGDAEIGQPSDIVSATFAG